MKKIIKKKKVFKLPLIPKYRKKIIQTTVSNSNQKKQILENENLKLSKILVEKEIKHLRKNIAQVNVQKKKEILSRSQLQSLIDVLDIKIKLLSSDLIKIENKKTKKEEDLKIIKEDVKILKERNITLNNLKLNKEKIFLNKLKNLKMLEELEEKINIELEDNIKKINYQKEKQEKLVIEINKIKNDSSEIQNEGEKLNNNVSTKIKKNKIFLKKIEVEKQKLKKELRLKDKIAASIESAIKENKALKKYEKVLSVKEKYSAKEFHNILDSLEEVSSENEENITKLLEIQDENDSIFIKNTINKLQIFNKKIKDKINIKKNNLFKNIKKIKDKILDNNL